MNFQLNTGQTANFDVPGAETDRDAYSREVFLSDGKTVKVEKDFVSGFWSITWPSGSVPEQLSGQYTTATYALNALSLYLSNETYNTTVVPEKVQKAELRVKNGKRDQ